MPSIAYAIVSPVRNEEAHILHTLQSVVSQTMPPSAWIIVDDGSTDGTVEAVTRYMEKYPFIQLVRRRDRGSYRLGGGVVEAFYEGLARLDLNEYEFVCKVDGDLKFPHHYFEILLLRATADPALGIVSGVTFITENGSQIVEGVPDFYAVGMAKTWRVACFTQIDGLVASLGWDVLDVVRAQMRGWRTGSYPDLLISHLRPMSSRNGWYHGRVRNGLTDYLLGYHPLFEVARCILRMTTPPYAIGGLCMLYGYIKAWTEGEPQIVTADEKRFFQRQQLGRLFGRRVK